MTSERLLVGAAKADITPDDGTQISGDIGRYRPVEEIRDRLCARIFVFRSADQTACIVACDMACISREHSLNLRASIAETIGARLDGVMIHCVQSHSAARVGGMFDDPEGILAPDLWWVRGETPAYNRLFMDRVLAGVAQAAGAMAPARAKFARTLEGRCAFNRRFIMRDGTVKTHPGHCNEDALYCEGPVDPEASMTLFEDDRGEPLAGLLHYTCHPIHGYPHRYISADWPGLWSEAVSQKLGGKCVVGCLNGACGNISPIDHTNPEYAASANMDLMVQRLSQTADTLLGKLRAVGEVPLKTDNRILRIPWNQPTVETVEAACRMIVEHPEPIFLDEAKESISWDWVFALRDLDKVSKLRTNPEYDFEIQVIRAGDLVIVGWPGEPFVEAQLEVKLKSPSRLVIVAHECNDECGYLPTMAAAQRGGYEAWGKLPPGTLEQVAEQTVAMIAALWYSPCAGAGIPCRELQGRRRGPRQRRMSQAQAQQGTYVGHGLVGANPRTSPAAVLKVKRAPFSVSAGAPRRDRQTARPGQGFCTVQSRPRSLTIVTPPICPALFSAETRNAPTARRPPKRASCPAGQQGNRRSTPS